MIIEDLAVDRLRMMRVIRAIWRPLQPDPPETFGPSGVAVCLHDQANRTAGSIIVTQAAHDGAEWIHASIAWQDHMPSYEDLTGLKDAVFGPEREAYQVFPPASRHVNIHDFALHLWGRADGTGALPELGAEGSI